MRYHALACDYDGTIAHHGRVAPKTLTALQQVKQTGRKIILVTGRQLNDLRSVFPEVDAFDCVVAENGALLYLPSTREERPLADPPDPTFIATLRKRGVDPLAVGHVIAATWEPNEAIVLDVIRELGLELQVIFNKGAVMILPSGTNKASGLDAALAELKLSPHNVVGVGDAENDHAFLGRCECSIAVSNALPALKEYSDFITRESNGAGVRALITMLLEDDLSALDSRLTRHHLVIGKRGDGDVTCKPFGLNLLVAGTSGGGKSTFATAFLERLEQQGYQFCIIDPEGDYQEFEGPMLLGSAKRIPTVNEIIGLLENPHSSCIVNLLGISRNDRPSFSDELLTRLMELRARTGRPHWVVIDETHHLLPADWVPAEVSIPRKFENFIFITVHPDSVAHAVLSQTDILVAIGDSPEKTIELFSRQLGEQPPQHVSGTPGPGKAIVWHRNPTMEPIVIQTIPPRGVHQRHIRKYAEGDLGEDRSFYFTGPERKLNLRAQNLMLFIQIADGVDDETWLYHLQRGDYSSWFRKKVKDDELAAAVAAIESQDTSAEESRRLIREEIERRYTAPA